MLSYDTPISRGTRVRIPFEPYMKFGIVTATGDSIKETGDLFNNTDRATNFQLLVTVWGNGTVNHNNNSGIGWDYNGAIGQPVASSSDTYFLDYKTDGFIEFINDDTGEVLVTSQLAYSGDLTLFTGTPDAYSVNTTIPSITTEDLSFTGGAINGFTKDGTGEDLIDASTMADGSVVTLDQEIKNNHRLVIRKEWIEDHVLPGLWQANETKQFFIGIPKANADWTSQSGDPNDNVAPHGNVSAEDFELAIGYHKTVAIAGSSYNVKLYKDGSQVQSFNVMSGYGLSTATHDVVFSNVDGRWEMNLFFWLSDTSTDAQFVLRQDDGGSLWTKNINHYNHFAPGPQSIVFASQKVVATLALTGLEIHREPFLPRDILVGEYSNGHTRFAQQPTADKFDATSNGHAWPGADWAHPTLVAGQTYRYIFHPSLEADDDIMIVRAADGVTYGTLTPFGSGDPSVGDGDYKGYTFTVPTDAPPLQIAFKNSNGGNTAFGNYKDLPVSGSTYIVQITGVTLEGPTGNVSGSTVTSDAWYRLNESMSAGERMIMNGTVLRSMFEMIDSDPGTQIQFNARDVNDWTENATANSSGLHDKWVRLRKHGSQYNITFFWGSASLSNLYLDTLADVEDTVIFYNLTASGDNVRHGMINDSNAEGKANSQGYTQWTGPKDQTGDQGYGLTEVQMQFRILPASSVDVSLVDWAEIYDIVAPSTAPNPITPWTKAVKFSGGSEHAKQVSNANAYNPIRMAGVNSVVDANSDLSKTSDHIDARPWAVACVFRIDGNASNQHIWNQGEGSGGQDDNIYLRLDSDRRLQFGWGRANNTEKIELDLGFIASPNNWYGIYICHKGQRLDAAGATASNLADAFDVRIMGATTLTGSTYRGQFSEVSDNMSTESLWNHSNSYIGNRMDRTIAGDFTLGGRGSNRSFHGYIASCVVTTLEQDAALPDTAEIKKMITDPEQWAADKDAYRPVGSIYGLTGFDYGNGDNQMTWATQVWLMGDGSSDSYPTVRNGVNTNAAPTQMGMVNMVANDVETVNIPGLS